MWLSLAYKMNGDPRKAAQFMMYGPPGVSGRDKAILDYSVFVSMMAQHYWQASNGSYMDPVSRKAMTAADVAAAEFPRAGALFVQRRQGSAPVVLAGASVGASRPTSRPVNLPPP